MAQLTFNSNAKTQNQYIDNERRKAKTKKSCSKNWMKPMKVTGKKAIIVLLHRTIFPHCCCFFLFFYLLIFLYIEDTYLQVLCMRTSTVCVHNYVYLDQTFFQLISIYYHRWETEKEQKNNQQIVTKVH